MIKFLYDNPQNHSRHRFWGLLLIFLILTAFATFLLISVLERFFASPTLTTLESTIHPVDEIAFPGVALCNLNKISKKRALKLAGDIANRTGENPEEIFKYIKFLGYLYDSNYNPGYHNQIVKFQRILEKLEMKMSSLTRTLVTPCEELLHTCHWKGVLVDCSKFFFLRLTFEGYCCTFNYAKNTSDWWKQYGNIKGLAAEVGISGMKKGLSIMLNNDRDDYLYTSLSSTGVNVHIFISTDYPDKSSGDLIENLATAGSENFLQIIPTTVRAVEDVMNYPVNKRDCLFEVEQLTQFGVYSQSDCFVDCRVRSMNTLCECIPFVIPLSTYESECTLLDLPCLNKYQKKWTMLVPDYVGDPQIAEQEDALMCPQTCYPSCEATLYKVASSSVPLFEEHLQNATFIHIFYGDRFHNLFLQDVVHYWFDMLSSVGGIFGLVMGLSLLSIVEGILSFIKLVIVKW